jgi:2-oxoglutarate ferredoxin oxidoreductase subunit beta
MTEKLFTRPKSLLDVPTHYCPGCYHGIIHRLIAEIIDELHVQDYTIGIAPVGCSVLAYDYFNFDMFGAAHGRAPAVATGVKRVHPDALVFTYQGDGDLAAIGCAEIVHAAARAEKFTTIFINNAIYGMTGGQMAPTTLLSQRTNTSPYGRNSEACGHPIRMSEMLATLEGSIYLARVSVHDAIHMTKAKRCIRKAFELQLQGKGFSMIEVLATCPTNWGMRPLQAVEWLKSEMIPYYPLGIIKDSTEVK